MKANKLLVLLPAFLLVGCAGGNASGNEAEKQFSTGVISSEKDKENFSNIYAQSNATLEKAESTASTTSNKKSLKRANESEVSSETTETESEVETSEGDESSADETIDITSFHADFNLDFEFAASLNGQELTNQSDVENYSIDMELKDDKVLMDVELSHSYSGSTYGVSYESGNSEIDIHYQDGTLYASQTVSNPWIGDINFKAAYGIEIEKAYSEFSDYFISMAENVKLDEDSELSAKDVIDQLLDEGKVIITSTKGNLVTADINYADGVATVTMDVVNKIFTSVKFDESAIFDAFKEKYNGTGLSALMGFSIDKAVFTVEMNFTYNDTTVTKLTDEEIASYPKVNNYNHYSDRNGNKNDDGNHGYHGGHDSVEM